MVWFACGAYVVKCRSVAQGMTWSKEQVDSIAEECLATDIEYDLAKMQEWDEDKIREYFENGGSETAPPPPEVSPVKPDIWSYIPDEVKWRANESVAVRPLRQLIRAAPCLQ